MNRPYVRPEIISIVIERDIKPKLKRPHIKKETMIGLQSKIRKYEIELEKEQLLAQKKMIQQMMLNEQLMANNRMVTNMALEEEEDMGMSL